MPGFGERRPEDIDLTDRYHIVDARGHRCPAPTLRLRRALEGLAEGERVTLLATDPMARVDVPFFLDQTGDVLIAQREADGVLEFTVEKRGGARTG